MKENLRTILKNVVESNDPFSQLDPYIYKGLTEENKKAAQVSGLRIHRGKVRQCIAKNDELIMVHTDNLSAFDRFITYVPFKGSLLTAITKFWFESLNPRFPHAYLSSPHERILRMKKLKPIKVEVIVRAYLAGSMQRAYEIGIRDFCGQTLAEGLLPYQRLPEPIITPTNKSENFEHDENRTPYQLVEEGVLSHEDWDKISTLAVELFSVGSEVYKKIGWILVDTKYEFGKDEDGKIYIIDEVHTPDSSRLWDLASYQSRLKEKKTPRMFDKELIRQYLLTQGYSGEGSVPPIPHGLTIEMITAYLNIVEKLWGRPFEVDIDQNMEKIIYELM